MVTTTIGSADAVSVHGHGVMPLGDEYQLTEIGLYVNGQWVRFVPERVSFAPVPHIEPLHWRKPEDRV
jgi:hypothetical protein